MYERDQAGNTKVYVWLDGRPLARIDNDAQIYYYHVDHLGTPQAMTNSTGATVWKADYEPFGKATIKVSTIENNLRLPGQYFDRETGLHYNYFRSSYDPGTGRYGEADPIGLAGGLNIYSYAEGNPVSKIDPLGLMGSKGYIAGRNPGSTVSVFGCLIGCVSSPLDGSTGPQASMEPTLGGGFEICEKPKSKPKPNQCDKPKPKNCGIYDPNCDNQIQPPGIPVPTGLGFIVGASIKKDGRICLRFGLFGEAPLVPSVELGDLDE